MSTQIHIKSLKSTLKENREIILHHKNWLIVFGLFIYIAVLIISFLNTKKDFCVLLGLFSIPYGILFYKIYQKVKVNKKIASKINQLKKEVE